MSKFNGGVSLTGYHVHFSTPSYPAIIGDTLGRFSFRDFMTVCDRGNTPPLPFFLTTGCCIQFDVKHVSQEQLRDIMLLLACRNQFLLDNWPIPL